jgi:tRNA A-37 threonylcarbamoyl transferase component Bud32
MSHGEGAEAKHLEEHRKFFREVLLRVNEIMMEKYNVHDVSVRPLGAGGARLSIPVRIEGTDGSGRKVRYFAKILGSSDIMTARTMQLMKNIYLETNSRGPLFDFSSDAEDMARHQFEQMSAIHRLGIPTARPLSYHPLKGQLWLFLAEYLEARPLPDVGSLDLRQVEVIMGYLEKMHHNGIYHGDLKPENIMFGDRIYILDIGHFLGAAPAEEKVGYDLASMVCALAEFVSVEDVVKVAGKYYKKKQMKKATEYLELIQRRPDFHISDEKRERLMGLMS